MTGSVSNVLAYLKQRQQPLWRLLAADHGPVVIGLLESYLLDKDRTLPASVLAERLTEDLRRLRNEGVDLEQGAEKLLAQWLKSGFLHRRLPKGASEEVFELTVEAANAIRFVRGMVKPRAAATESRLSIVLSQLVTLAQSTEPAPAARLDALRRERDRIDAEIAEVEAGRWTTLRDDRAIERTNEILGQADDLVGDFRRVRDEFDTLHRRLRTEVVESEAGRGDVLGKMFEGVDLIANSDAGATFRAFYALLTDPSQAAALYEAIDAVLSRDFLSQMDRADRKMLRGLPRILLREAEAVHEVMQFFAKSLKEFVTSNEYRELRYLSRVIKDGQRSALRLKEMMRPEESVGISLALTGAQVRSHGSWKLFDPDQVLQPRGMEDALAAPLNDEELRAMIAHGEVDFAGLVRDIKDLLETKESASVADVLEFRPARQGLGSVLGLVVLADQFGMVTGTTERVEWTGQDGVRRWSEIPICYFIKERHDAVA